MRMVEVAEAAEGAVEKGGESKLNTTVAALVAITATFMAVCNVKDGNVTQAMAQAQTRAVNQWAYFQSKSTKQHMSEQMVDQLIIQRASASSTLGEQARGDLDKKITEYSALAKKYEHEKADIQAKAEGFEKEYDRLNVHDDQFDMSEASTSVAIALFGVTALTQKRWLLGVATVVAFFGVLCGLGGFFGWSFHPDWLAKVLG
jgi:hypothetical protein